MSGEGSREALRLKQLRGKKERLGYAVERLVLQAQQKERQLRVSHSSPFIDVDFVWGCMGHKIH